MNDEKPVEEKPNIPDNSEFKEVVQESRDRIRTAELPPPKATGKRGRGRPRKTDAGPAPVQGAAPQTNPPPGPPPGGVDLTPHLVMPITLVSLIPARRFRCEGLIFTNEEAMALATALNGVFNAFVPDMSRMSPKTAAVLTFGITAGSIGVIKYQIYLEHLANLRTKKPEPTTNPLPQVPVEPQVEQKDGEAPPMPEGGVLATDAFKKQPVRFN